MALRQALDKVRSSGKDLHTIQVCVLTIHTVAENAAQKWNPNTGAKFRTIKQSNAGISNKVTSVPGGSDCLLALGFIDTVQDGEPVWHVPQDRACVDKLWDGLAMLRAEKESLASVAVDQEKSAAANSGGGIEGMIRDMLSSPSKLNQILRNPMVKQMIASNPDMVESLVSSTPEAREALRIYPEMRSQLEAVMGRPLQLQEAAAVAAPAPSPGTALGSTAFAPPARPVTALSVQAYVYDITQGMAKSMSMMLVGKQLDLVPHTGIVVFGREYFFGSGPQVCDRPGQSVPVPVAQTLVLGETKRSREELEAHINSVLALEHTEQNYNLLSHNCNHYADDVAKFLLGGQGLPSHVVNFGQEALSTPQGQQMRGMIENMERNMRQGSGGAGMNPFGSGAAAGAPAPLNPVPAGVPVDAQAGIVSQLQEMGFPLGRCQEAAASCGGDVDLALALVMSQGD